jgi:hypothetical protein
MELPGNRETTMAGVTYATIRIPVKSGADVDSKFQGLLKSAIVSMAGGSRFCDLSEEERSALAWVHTAEF